MAVNKLDPKIIFASEASAQDTPAVFNNRTLGWGESRKNGGRPTIKQMNALQQDTELKILWLNENAVTPFDATIDYPVNAVTIKDGQFKIFNGTSWDLFLDKSFVGLSNVDNTSDLNKPISTAVQTELDYIDNNGAALPYKDGIAYEENAVVVKDGVLQQWKGGVWVLVKPDHNDLIGRDAAEAHPASAISYGSISQEVHNKGLESITEMLSVTNPKDGMRVFVKGSQGGWFTYDPSKIAENDGGTVFNGWGRIDFDHITFDMFGCDQNGLVDIDDKLLKICAASTALKKPIHNFSGTYLVNSANEFVFTENTLLDGSVFKLGSNFSGKFTCTRNDIISITLTSGADFDSIKAVGALQRGRNKLNAIGLDNYPDHYAKFETSQPLYIYRSITKTAPLFTRILRNRTLLSAPMFDLDLSQLTAIKLQRVASSVRLFSGFCFDETDATNLGMYFNAIDSNSMVLRNIRYIDNSTINRSGNQYRFNVSGCYGVLLSNINAVSAMQNADNTFNYTLGLNSSYDVLVDGLKAFGDGWGSTGSNSCARIEFRNSDVNRVDFHEPCYEYLKIRDCNIGVWGILVTMIGDLHISDSTEITHEGLSSRGYIRSRPDAGGFCYGDLHINNLTLMGYNGNNREFIVAEGNGVLPVGSPISPVMFENIYINNIKSKQSLSNVSKLMVSLTSGTALLPPKKISIDKLTGFNPEIDFGGFALRSGVVRLDYLNVDNPYLYIADSSDKGTKVKAKIFNLSANGSPATVLNTANADIDIIESNLVWYREYYNKWNTFSPKIRINGGEISDQSPVSLPTGVTNSRVRLNNVNITAAGMESLIGNLLPKAKFTDCLFGFAGFIPLWTGSGVSTGSATVHASSGLVNFVFGYGGARRCVEIDVFSSATYTLETGVTVVVTITGSTATVTLNATNANLIGFVSSK